jgi:hypothetical protein
LALSSPHAAGAVEIELTIVPKAGTALLFQHMLLHAGTRVRSGVKMVLRSDVLYRPER